MLGRLLLIGALALAAAPAPGAGQTTANAPSASTTVILVRHAEAIPNAGTDPGLSEAGTARALALRDALKDAQVSAVLTTQYERTIRTGAPLAEAMKAPLVNVQVQGGPGSLDAHVQGVVQMVHARYTGGTVVIVGHSNTIPALVKGFSGVDPGEIAHDVHSAMFIVTTSSPGTGKLVRAQFGAR